MDTIFGMKVMTSPLVKPVPVLQLSHDFNACTDTFKLEMNAWLLGMFGTKEVMYAIGNDTLVLNNAMLAKIRKSISNNWMMQHRGIPWPPTIIRHELETY